MRGMSTSLVIVVTIVVLLVTALVILVIFSGGIVNATSMTSFASSCRTQAESTCRIFGQLPPNWLQKVNINENGKVTPKSCDEVVIPKITPATCKTMATTTPAATTPAATPTCGGAGQSCCTNGVQCQTGFTCSGGKCILAGSPTF